MESRTRRRLARWLPLVFLVLALAFAAVKVGDVRKLPHLILRARWEWLLAAIAFQAGTYFGVGLVYRTLGRALKADLSWAECARLAVVNLFVNSAVPSAGFSGNVFLVRILSKKGVPAGRSTIVVLLERTIYFSALVAFAALVILDLLARGHVQPLEIVAAAVLATVVVGLVLLVRKMLVDPRAVARRLSGWLQHAPRFIRKRLDRSRLIGEAREIEQAGGASALGAGSLLLSVVGEFILLACDALTVWALFRAISVPMSAEASAMGYVLATLIAQVVVIPGGMEVGLAGVLHGLGAGLGAAIAVTLLFNAATFLLPLPFGWWFYRQAERTGEGAGEEKEKSESGAEAGGSGAPRKATVEE